MNLSKSERKKFRIRNKIKKVSSNERFRLSVSRSSKNISAQIIDDSRKITLVSATSNTKEIKSKPEDSGGKAKHYLEGLLKIPFGIFKDNKVMAIEGKGCTKMMLRKCKKFKIKNKGVLVKFPKKKQDLRIDLPTVGYKTFIQCKSVGLKGIVLKSKSNVLLEKKKCINFANKNKMFLIAK